MSDRDTKIIVIGTYFGHWPIWFPAFLLSCAKNETIQWLFFTDCEIPQVSFPNIKFVRMNLIQLNELASRRLGLAIHKNAYSQLDLRPAYGVIFEDFIQGYEFWGHCDFDVVWGDIRNFFTDDTFKNFDIISPRKDFLAGHLTLWRNIREVNELFRSVPAYKEILTSNSHFNFDESIVSIHIKQLTIAGRSKIRVMWTGQMVVWFHGDSAPYGWHWENGKMMDSHDHEHIYLHFQDAKKFIERIDFQVGEYPSRFSFTSHGLIRSRPPSMSGFLTEAMDLKRKKALLRGWLSGVIRNSRLLKRMFCIRNLFWAREILDNSISVTDVEFDKNTNRLFLKRLGIHIGEKQRFILKAYSSAVILLEHKKVEFKINNNDELLSKLDGWCFLVKSPDEIIRLKEIMTDGIYDTTFIRPTVFLDIGMRGGAASLYFANQPNVAVVGYEPSKLEYDQTLHNISLNPELADRIHVVQKGMGGATFSTIAVYYKGVEEQSHHYLSFTNPCSAPRFEYEEVEVDDIAMVIDSITSKFPGREIVVKIDFESSVYFLEGTSEYLVVDRLQKTDKLNSIDMIFIKWQKSKPEHDASVLVQQLSDSGFAVLKLSPYYPNAGILYAVRRKSTNFMGSQSIQDTGFEAGSSK